MLHVHLVFVTKYRRDVLSELAIRDLRNIFVKVCLDFEAELIECDGEDDRVHLLVHYPPKVALSRLGPVDNHRAAMIVAQRYQFAG